MAKLFFFDLETTSVDNQRGAIHQIAGCIEIDGVIKEEFDFKIAPHDGAYLDPMALEICGVTEEQIRAYESPSHQYSQLIAMMSKYVDKFDKKDKFFLVGFNNAVFDNQFLRNFFTRLGDKYFGSWFWANCIDLMVFATLKLMPNRPKMSDFQLKTVARELGIEIDQTRLHEAGYDIYLTREIHQICTGVK